MSSCVFDLKKKKKEEKEDQRVKNFRFISGRARVLGLALGGLKVRVCFSGRMSL